MAVGLPLVEYVRPRPSVRTCLLALCMHLFSTLGMGAPAALKLRVVGAEPGGLPGSDARRRGRQPGRAPRHSAAGCGRRGRLRQPH